MRPKAFYYLNSNVLRITGLRNIQTKEYVDNTMGVTVSVTLTPAVTGGDRSLTHVGGSKGVWQTIYPSDVGVTLGQTYTATITADGGTSFKGRWNVALVVEERLEH